MQNIQLLIENIKQCNLSDEDKKILLEKLQKETPDIEGFLQTFIMICKISKEILKFFDIDLWD